MATMGKIFGASRSFNLAGIALLFAFGGAALSAQQLNFDQVEARRHFQDGVRAYHRALYNDAIVSFNQSLSSVPDDSAVIIWLGRAYYRSGFNDSAIARWTFPLENGLRSNYLEQLVDVELFRRDLDRANLPQEEYHIAAEIKGHAENGSLFRRPTSILPRDDGSIIISSFSSGELVILDVNGRALSRWPRDVIRTLDAPFDLVEFNDGSIAVTEFNANRVSFFSSEGFYISSFGEGGTGDGQFFGPQFIALDQDESIYISDWGNRRVIKHDRAGNFLFELGTFNAPVGIASLNERIYVLDAENKTLTVFDRNGNRFSELAIDSLNGPEGLAKFDDSRLLIADSEQIALYNPDRQTTDILAREDSNSYLIDSARDSNKHLLALDHLKNKVNIYIPFSTLSNDLIARVERIDSSSFPAIVIDLVVEDRFGNPIVGLGAPNFFIREENIPIEGATVAKIDRRDRPIDMVLVLEDSPVMRNLVAQRKDAVEQIGDAILGKGAMSMVVAGEIPVLAADRGSSAPRIDSRASEQASYSENWAFDAGVRLAGNLLAQQTNKRVILFIGSGQLNPFESIGLQETAQFLRNNNILFFAAFLRKEAANESIEYIARETGGEAFWIYRAKAMRRLLDKIALAKSGRYGIRYRSPIESTDFGRRYIPVSIETYLYQRSGREENGYYPPLSF